MTSKKISLVATLIVLSVVSFFFIRFTNDHKECGTETYTKTEKNGDKVLVKKHICREKYNL